MARPNLKHIIMVILMKDRLILALDDMTREKAISLVNHTKDMISTYKIGLHLFYTYGPSIVREIRSMGVEIFLDLKLHDIPMQVAKSITALLDLEIKFITIHALGGLNMLKAAKEAILGSKTRLLSVSILTSISESDYQQFFLGQIKDGVLALAKMSLQAGINGFICSPLEVSSLKTHLGSDCLAIVPGIRAHNSEYHDQKRVLSAKKAIDQGADFLVLGRVITHALDIRLALKNIYDEIVTI